MSLWYKPAAAITWQDVVDFCDAGYTEGVRVDYKEDFPDKDKLEKTVAALGNTLGGVILVGIKADRVTNKPVAPYEGIVIPKGTTERIDKICLDNIYPSLLPETIAVMRPEASGRGVIVVRVPESVQAPHAIQNRTAIYVRRDDHSDPEELASLGWIEHLLHRRTNPEAKRLALRQAAIERVRQTAAFTPLMTLAVSPTYPARPLQPDRAVLDWASSGRYSQGRETPIQPCAGGVFQIRRGRLANAPDTVIRDYMELRSVGFAFFSDVADVRKPGKNDYVPERYVEQKDLIEFTLNGLADAHAFLAKLGYGGTVTATLELLGVAGWGIQLENGMPENVSALSRDQDVQAEATVVEPMLFTEETARGLINQIRWAMGFATESRASPLYQGLLRDAARRG